MQAGTSVLPFCICCTNCFHLWWKEDQCSLEYCLHCHYCPVFLALLHHCWYCQNWRIIFISQVISCAYKNKNANSYWNRTIAFLKKLCKQKNIGTLGYDGLLNITCISRFCFYSHQKMGINLFVIFINLDNCMWATFLSTKGKCMTI